MGSGKCSIKADFLECQGRKLFYLLLQPVGPQARGSVLYLPPFTEEMHKARHMVASQARDMAARGFNVLLPDLTGCGDSGGEFAEADWQTWLEDANAAADLLAGLGSGPLVVWGLRMGALLACELSRGRTDIAKLVIWQPALNGEQQIDQFLRLRTVPAAVNSEKQFDRTMLWNELRAGRSLEIAGYELSPALALEIAKVRLHDLCPACPVHWLEIGTRPGQGPAIASENVMNHWRERGVELEVTTVEGDPFWRNAESGVNGELKARTMEILVP